MRANLKQIAAVPIFNHGGADVGVAESLLDRADIVAIFQQRDGEGVAGPPGWLGEASPEPCLLDGLLDHRFLHDNSVCPYFLCPHRLQRLTTAATPLVVCATRNGQRPVRCMLWQLLSLLKD